MTSDLRRAALTRAAMRYASRHFGRVTYEQARELTEVIDEANNELLEAEIRQLKERR